MDLGRWGLKSTYIYAKKSANTRAMRNVYRVQYGASDDKVVY